MSSESAPLHPGIILLDQVMSPLGVSRNKLARDIDVPVGRISDIVNGKRGITADTALRLAKYFGTASELWMRLQSDYDLHVARETTWPKVEPRVRVFEGGDVEPSSAAAIGAAVEGTASAPPAAIEDAEAAPAAYAPADEGDAEPVAVPEPTDAPETHEAAGFDSDSWPDVAERDDAALAETLGVPWAPDAFAADDVERGLEPAAFDPHAEDVADAGVTPDAGADPAAAELDGAGAYGVEPGAQPAPESFWPQPGEPASEEPDWVFDHPDAAGNPCAPEPEPPPVATEAVAAGDAEPVRFPLQADEPEALAEPSFFAVEPADEAVPAETGLAADAETAEAADIGDGDAPAYDRPAEPGPEDELLLTETVEPAPDGPDDPADVSSRPLNRDEVLEKVRTLGFLNVPPPSQSPRDNVVPFAAPGEAPPSETSVTPGQDERPLEPSDPTEPSIRPATRLSWESLGPSSGRPREMPEGVADKAAEPEDESGALDIPEPDELGHFARRD